MNRILLTIIFILGSLWAVKPVIRNEKPDENEKKPVIQIQIPKESKENTEQKKTIEPKVKEQKNLNNKNDQFIDADSNNVNDQREDDLLKIKQLKTKFRDLFKKGDDKKTEPKNPAKSKKRTNK